MTTPHASAYALALGDDLASLHPKVRAYFEGPAAPGQVGIGTGVFDRVGSVKPWLRWAMRPVAGPRLFLARSGRNVPFTVENRPGVDGDGHPTLEAIRTFRFTDAVSIFEDIITTPGPGLVLDRLGSRRRIESLLRIEATPEGHVRMSSVSTAIRLGRIRIPLPRFLGVQVEGTDGYDEAAGRQTVSVVGTNPLLGTMIEYRGWFTYRYEEIEAL